MYLNETYGEDCVGKNLSDAIPIQNNLKKGGALSPLLFSFALPSGSQRKGRGIGIEWDTSASSLR
jgi:hypothetical protein